MPVDVSVAARPVQSGTNPSVLEAIRDEDCSLAIWQRGESHVARPLPFGKDGNLRLKARREAIDPALRAALPAGNEALIEDAAALAERFGAIMEFDAVALRLEIVETDACRIAAGEQPEDIHSLQPGDVGIFKGRLSSGKPAIHRSPPIGGSGERRLLLVVNPVTRDVPTGH
ncbi:DUF1826 domain-containing protein [Pseudoblastomonas halimionae]|uniref:DUF1826 domain-containing protein n=1 Tax=Alteriqipengyuania halimionae TaxID=1926630 RepID=A0A6I4U651_9SPHN|nr:DUF1826 domain-containing protein [Alteriqipengyuania halimionae]MXP10343.1 DUF1826 domain-containing protein [Alteriqipengyuania halimionae]